MRLPALLLLALAGTAGAQGRIYPERKVFLAVGDAIATSTGGALGGTTLLQAMRASAVVGIHGDLGVDVTLSRLQTIVPPGGRANDLEFANPQGDALTLSFVQFGRTRARGIPSALTLGGGVIRRKTSEAGRTRDTWVARAGYDSDPFWRRSHSDAGVGFHMFLMPANANSMVYVATLGLFFRIG
jgi:hypothetical protein